MGSAEWIAFGSLLFVIASGGGGVIWRLGTVRTEILGQIGKGKLDAVKQIADVKKELEEKLDRAYMDFGDAPLALREKLSILELHVEREFVSKREYDKDQAQLMEFLKGLRESVEKRLDKIDEKLEKNAGSQHRH